MEGHRQFRRGVHDGKEHSEGQGVPIDLDSPAKIAPAAEGLPQGTSGTQPVGASVDVTRQQNAEQALLSSRCELARAWRAATVFALSASIAHELNQPLGAVIMDGQTCLRWLRRDPPDIKAAVAAAERAVRAGLRASEIVRETRDLLAGRSRRDELVDLPRLVLEVVALLEREITEHSARVSTVFAADLQPILIDRTSMQQVLVNLVINALQAMADCPLARREVGISIDKPDESHVRLRVRDRGPGIAEHHLARVLEPLFTTKADGMGLGLAISRMAIEAGGGGLLVSNHKEGGALFECLLPTSREVAA